MIHLTRLNHIPMVVNSDLIEQIEMTPDTVITLTTGQKFMVLEDADEVIQRIVQFRRSLLSGLPVQSCDFEPRHLHTRIPPA
jgi:flagellar protein FlbD